MKLLLNKMSFGITILTFKNNEILFSTLRHLVERTNFIKNTEVHILAQCCSKAYIKTLETICKAYDNPCIVKFILHTTDENLGVSKGGNLLFNHTKHIEFILNLEDDWVLITDNKDWLIECYDRIDSKNQISTIALRKYGSDREKWQYGWTRTIPYLCHIHQNNFNYSEKLKDTDNPKFKEIDHFLFTFNPVIRRNEDYVKVGVYPLPEFEDGDNEVKVD